MLQCVSLQIQQLHYAEEKARADFSDLVNRTSNYKALQVSLCVSIFPTLDIIPVQEAKRHQLDAIDASRPSNVAIGLVNASLSLAAHALCVCLCLSFNNSDRFHSIGHSSLNVTVSVLFMNYYCPEPSALWYCIK